ncbi:MAG: sugar phosphate isomerase/epimerase family protein [Isosphaeraceae bacterium]
MIRSPLGLRINPKGDRSPRDQLQEAAKIGAKGVILDAVGDLAPDRLSETGRREIRHLLRTTELTLIGLGLPTRRAFDTDDQLEARLARADRAFALAFELGARLVLARVGTLPSEADASRLEVFTRAVGDLARRADHRGVRLTIETNAEPGGPLRTFLDGFNTPSLAVSLDPLALIFAGQDPNATTRALAPLVAHVYANEATSGGRTSGAVDWAEYLGTLEEIDYRGFLTVWPDPSLEPSAVFARMVERFKPF